MIRRTDAAWDRKVYTLESNVPLMIPPGQQFMVLAAGARNQLSVAVGDSNNDFSSWFEGITLYFDEPTSIRLLSPNPQQVTLLVAGGPVSFADNPADFKAIGSGNYVEATGAAVVGITSILSAAANVSGLDVIEINGAVAATAGLAANLRFLVNSVPFFCMRAPALSTNNIPFVLPVKTRIQPGSSLSWENVNATPYSFFLRFQPL
jgi:hypothetical protein